MARLCLIPILKELRISVEYGRVVTTLNIINHSIFYILYLLVHIVTLTTKIESHGHMTYHDLNNSCCKLKCKKKGSIVNILLLFICATKKSQFNRYHASTTRVKGPRWWKG